uniref:HTH HARE-type domain-containing protein n=1 Tax=candidate division WOR-3 bacterium TaxID=2052148 RepID=A0A7V1EH56_UNCW3
MKQYEAVIRVMEENGGYATLGFLYQEALKIPNVKWGTKTPFASIRRIVQDKRFFFKIKPGLWALKSYANRLPDNLLSLIEEDRKEKLEGQFTHSYFQGLVVEIGNLKDFLTYVPPQDQNKKFLNKNLGEVIKLKTMLEFTYNSVLEKVKSIDVWWFNERNFPAYVFEIEHTSDFRNALIKFLELQDFNARTVIVSSEKRKNEFVSRIKFTSFAPIKDRVIYMTYDYISQWHSKLNELIVTEKIIS